MLKRQKQAKIPDNLPSTKPERIGSSCESENILRDNCDSEKTFRT